MPDLSHWKFVEAFTGREAVALIFGQEPTSVDDYIVAPLLRRMSEAYQATLWAHQDAVRLKALMEEYPRALHLHELSEWQFQCRLVENSFDSVYAPKNLHSWRMTAYYPESWDTAGRVKGGLAELADCRFWRWLADEGRNGFDHQLFEPFEIARWVEAVGIHSKYQFDESDDDSLSTQELLPGSPNSTGARRDVLTPVIEHAQSMCRNCWDAAEVWGKLQSL